MAKIDKFKLKKSKVLAEIRDFATIPQAAAKARVTKSTVYKWIDRGIAAQQQADDDDEDVFSSDRDYAEFALDVFEAIATNTTELLRELKSCLDRDRAKVIETCLKFIDPSEFREQKKSEDSEENKPVTFRVLLDDGSSNPVETKPPSNRAL